MYGDGKLSIDPLTIHSYLNITTKEAGMILEIEAISKWTSIRANTAVFANMYYYECQIMTSGVMQIGWSTLETSFTNT